MVSVRATRGEEESTNIQAIHNVLKIVDEKTGVRHRARDVLDSALKVLEAALTEEEVVIAAGGGE